jgi:hypothetical protein
MLIKERRGGTNFPTNCCQLGPPHTPLNVGEQPPKKNKQHRPPWRVHLSIFGSSIYMHLFVFGALNDSHAIKRRIHLFSLSPR